MLHAGDIHRFKPRLTEAVSTPPWFARALCSSQYPAQCPPFCYPPLIAVGNDAGRERGQKVALQSHTAGWHLQISDG